MTDTDGFHVSLGVWVPPAPAIAASKTLNVLAMLTDDLGLDQQQISGHSCNSTTPSTPNLAAHQTAGLIVCNAWTTPACSTARGVLYPSRYPFRTELEAPLGTSELATMMVW